jgi:hydroxymethylglutaryl-CoA reductase
LEILGIERTKKGAAVKLAEAVGLAVLAGELSLTAALAGRDLGRAHQKLGRSK